MVFFICALIYILGSVAAWFAILWCLYQFQVPINGNDVKFFILVLLLSWLGFIAVLVSFLLTKIKHFDWEKLAKKINKIFYRPYKGC